MYYTLTLLFTVLFSLSNDQKSSLASPEKVQNFVEAYQEHFGDQADLGDDIPILEQYESVNNSYAEAIDGQDTGIDVEL